MLLNDIIMVIVYMYISVNTFLSDHACKYVEETIKYMVSDMHKNSLLGFSDGILYYLVTTYYLCS